MGAQVGGADAAKRMQLAAAGRARRADAIGRQEGEDQGSGSIATDIAQGGLNNAGINFGPGRANRGGPMDMISQGGTGSYAQFLQGLAQRKGGRE